MKIAHLVESYSPSVGGMQEVVKQLSERLVAFGHVVSVLTSKNPNRINKISNSVEIVEFDIQGNFVKGYVGSDVEKFKNHLLNTPYDVIVCFAAQQWATDLCLEILPKLNSVKIFVPTGFSALNDPMYSDYFKKMSVWMKNFDCNVFLSAEYRDINFFRTVGGGSFEIIPNGADEQEFLEPSSGSIRTELNIPEDHRIILMVGSHTGIKGHSEALGILNKANISKVTFLIVGNVYSRKSYFKTLIHSFLINLFNRSQKKILLLSISREKTVQLFKEADLFLFPSNIECSPIVLFEACASRTPFLTTDVGNATEIVQWTQGGLILPTLFDAKGFSKANVGKSAKVLEEIMNDPERRNIMANRGFESWRQTFTWQITARKYEELYKKFLGLNK